MKMGVEITKWREDIGLRGWPKYRKRATGNLGSRTQASRWSGRGVSIGWRISVLCLSVLVLSFVDLYICSYENDLSLSFYPSPKMFIPYRVDRTGEDCFINCLNRDFLLKLLQRGGIEMNPGPPPKQTRLNSAGEIELQASASSDFEEIKKMLVDLTGKVNAVASDIKGIHDQLDGITSFQNQQSVINKNVSSEMESLNSRIAKLENDLKRRNLIFSGVKCDEGSDVKTNVKKSLIGHLNWSEDKVSRLDIDSVLVLGLTPNQKSKKLVPDIIVSFARLSDKLEIVKAVKSLKPDGLFVRDDFCKLTRDIRRKLAKIMQKAKEDGCISFLAQDKLIIKKDGKKNTYTYNLNEDKVVTLNESFVFKFEPEDIE